MNQQSTTKKILSVIISVVMLLSAFPLSIFAVGETEAAKREGVWNYTTSVLNDARTSFSSNGQNDISMAVADTDFFFMQTEDNQVMTYSTVFYCKKNSRYANIHIVDVTTNQADSNYNAAYVENSENWALTIGNVNDGGDSSPDGDELTGSGISSVTFTGYTYSAQFVADGSAVYNPQWIIRHQNRSETFTTADTGNPAFTLTVVDMRELLEMVNVVTAAGKDTSAVLGSFDLTGSTYYSQDEVDDMTAQVSRLLYCDYSALDDAIAQAEALATVPGAAELGEYAAMASVLADAKALSRTLEDTPENQAAIDALTQSLLDAIADVESNICVVSYYVDGVLYATSECVPNAGYNFHDVTDHFVAEPTKANATFDGWRDADGKKVKPNTPVNSSFSVYAHFVYVTGDATGPVKQLERWNHDTDTAYSDGRGINGLTMWVENIEFYFVRTYTGQKFSFNTAVSAVRNGADRAVRLTNVVFKNSSNSFITENNLTNDDIKYYNEIPGNDSSIPAKPADSASCNLPYVTGATFEEQLENSVRSWRYIYTFEAACNEGTEKVYNFDWQITYKHGTSSPSTSVNDTVPFTIKVTDLRQIIKVFAKARSVANNANSPLSPERQAQLVNLVNEIDENYTFDGTEYYTQTEINNLVAELNSYIEGTDFPCDYSDLDAAIALAETYDIAGNNADRHYLADEWNYFITAYNEAVAVDRNLYIDNNNVNQPLIDAATEKLEYAIEALSYKTHENPKADTTALQEAVDNAESIINANPDAYTPASIQALEDAIDAAEDIISNPPYDNGDGTAQQIIQDAIDAINNALQGLTPDKSGLQDKIDEGNNTDTTGMTPESVQALEDAIDAAEDVLNDPDATVDEIQDAIDAIDNAINGLTPDKTELEQKIDEGENTDTTGMTPESVQALEDAIDAAEDVLNDPNATVDDIQDAIDAIDNAINGLTPDKSELEAKIEEGNNTDTTGMTPDSVQALEDAIDAAEDVLNDPDATVDEIQDAIDAIDNAINGLTPDKTELEQKIDEGENTDTTGMTPDSVQALEDAIDAAEDVLNDPDATVDEIQDAIEAIDNAINGLTPDKSELEAKIDEGNNTDTTGMTPDSVQALEDAIDAAEDVLNDPNATVDEIQDAIDAIDNAINGLTPDKTELEAKIEEGNNTDTTGMTPDSVQALEDAIDAAEDVLNDPDATVDEIQDAIDAIDNAINGLTPDKTALEQEIIKGQNEASDPRYLDDSNMDALEDAITDAQDVYNNPDATVSDIANAIQAIEDAIANLVEITELIPTTDGGIIVDRTDTEYYYMVGLDANDTSFANIKSKLENDGRMVLAFRGETQLGDSDLIGTGCVIKCVSINDPSIVYEQATVILYGDVNGDGLVNATDYDAMFNESLLCQQIEGRLFRIAGDVNGDTVIDGFDMAKVELQISGARALDQTAEFYK